jgi:hypothetical protein
VRRSHILTLAKTLKFPEHLIFIDTETTTLTDKEDEHRPQLIVGVSQYVRLDKDLNVIDQDQRIFKSLDDLYSWLLSFMCEYNTINIFAHNWSFDFPVIDGFNFFYDQGYELKMIVDGSPPIILKYQKEKNLVMIIDSMNFFVMPLSSMGELVGVKKHTDIKLGVYSQELEDYCIDDVNILRLSIINLLKFLRDNDLCRFNHTTSSLALNTFTRKFLKHQIFIDGDEKKTMLGRKSYFGGRTECFRIGDYKGPFYLIDVNSMYPFVMANNDYPVKTFKSSLSMNVKDLPKLIDRYSLTIDCIVNTDEPVYPKIINTRTCFPVGRFRAYLSTPEIEHAISNDHIESVRQVVMYEKANIFSDYVKFFYDLRNKYRKSGNKVYDKLSKLLMNSLYGKFGQSHKYWEESQLEPTGTPHTRWYFDIDQGKRVYVMELNNKVYKAEFTIESRDSFPAIASHVTAFARLYLYNTLSYIGRNHVYYCDTDSLLLDQVGYNKIKNKLNDSTLGCWSLDGTYDKIEIRGNKDYTFGSKNRIKGIRPKAVEIEPGTYRQLQFGSLRGVIRSSKIDAPIIKHIVKHLTRDYKKGQVLPSGEVIPFKLDDLGD